MKFLTGTLGIIIVGFLIQSFSEWWTIAIIALVFGILLNVSTIKSFIFGFLGVFLLWGGYATFLNAANESILATKMGVIFSGLSPVILILITALLGGIVGGFAALSGKLGREMLSK